MSRPDREILERLGRRGLVRVLGDLLDPNRLVSLANACGIRYPGMRTQSQKREKLLGDLAEKASIDDASGKAVLRVLLKETSAAARAWGDVPAGERLRRLEDGDLPGVNGQGKPGLRVFLAASSPPDPDLDAYLFRMVQPDPADARPGEGVPAADAESLSKEAARYRKKCAELQKKVRYLENQITKNRDAEKSYKRDLIQRKGELAEARMLAERLRRELEEARGAAAAAGPGKPERPDGAALDGIERDLKKLAADQRKLAHRLEKLAEAPAPTVAVPPEVLAPVASALDDVQKELAALKKERRKDQQEHAKRLDELQAAVQAARSAAEESTPRPSRPAARRKGEPERVGVFIDVQNMYYAAKQLKGKLDFDALLETAVLGRRLIQATAYVVESKETDQFGFFNMLQQRAIELRRKTLKVRADGSMKGDWDMEMALDILDAAPKLDVVVLVSGDGDFTSLVQRVKRMGPRVEVLGFPRNTAKSLLEAADRFTPLDRKFVLRTDRGPAEAASIRTVPPNPPPDPVKPAPAPDSAPVAEEAVGAPAPGGSRR